MRTMRRAAMRLRCVAGERLVAGRERMRKIKAVFMLVARLGRRPERM